MSARRRRPRSPVEQADIKVAKALTPMRKQLEVQAVGAMSEIGDQPPLYAISGAVIAAGLIFDNPRTLRAGARMMGAHALATTLKSAVKHLVDRSRPYLLAKGQYKLAKGERDDSDFSSFPSGHTASSIAVARALGRAFPRQRNTALAAASAVAVVQVLRSKHFMTDILAGAAIGLAAEAVIDSAFKRLHDLP